MIRFVTDTAHFRQLADSVQGDLPPLEERLAAAVAAMRAKVQDYGDADFNENRARTLLDQRPLIVIALALDGNTYLWAMEPGIEEWHAGLLEARIDHWQDADGHFVHVPMVGLEWKQRALIEAEEAIDWKVWEMCGDHLAGRQAAAD